MRELWKAFITRLVYMLTPKPHVPPPAPVVLAPEPPLKPGVCQCYHGRNAHADGKGRCHGMFRPNSSYNDTNDWLGCSCQIYIPKRDDPSDQQPEYPTPSADELEKMFK
jgi:hypothetical protein